MNDRMFNPVSYKIQSHRHFVVCSTTNKIDVYWQIREIRHYQLSTVSQINNYLFLAQVLKGMYIVNTA